MELIGNYDLYKSWRPSTTGLRYCGFELACGHRRRSAVTHERLEYPNKSVGRLGPTRRTTCWQRRYFTVTQFFGDSGCQGGGVTGRYQALPVFGRDFRD